MEFMNATFPFISLITGLPGSGKTTIANQFQNKPLDGWQSFDFDKGKYKIPPTDNTEVQYKQLVWWLEKAANLYRTDGTKSVIFGFWGFPENLERAITEAGVEVEAVKIGYLYADIYALKSRKIVRGEKQLYDGELTGWKKAFIEALDEIGARRFDTTNATVEETYKEVKDWLRSSTELS